MRVLLRSTAALFLASLAAAAQAPQAQPAAVTIVRPARVFDGDAIHEGWSVRVRGDRIEAAGPDSVVAQAGVRTIDLPGATLTPGLIEGHSHLLLHAYSEASWVDQVSREGFA